MDFTLKGITYVVFRYKTSLLLFSLYLALGFALFMQYGKKTYKSDAEILVRFGQEQLASSSVSSVDSRVFITRREQEIQNEIRILTSADTLMSVARIIAGPGATEDDRLALRSYLQDNLEVSAMKNSDIVTAEFSFPDPLVAQEVLTLVIQQYQIHHSAVYFNSSEMELVKSKMSAAHEDYSVALDRLTQFEIASKLYDNSQILELASNIEAQKIQLNNLRNEYVYTKLKRDRYQELLGTVPKNVLFIVREIHNNVRDDFRGRLSELVLEKERLLSRYNEDYHSVVNVQREIDSLTALIDSEPQRLVNEKETRPNESWTAINDTLLTLSPEVDAMRARIDNFAVQIADMEDSLVEANKNKSMYSLLSRDVELKKGIYDQFYQDYTAAIGKQDAQTNSITNASVVAQPSLNTEPTKPNKKRFFAVAAAVLLFGNLFILSVRVFADNTISTPEQAEHVLGHQVLSTFGELSRRGLEPGEATRAAVGPPTRSFERQRSAFRQLYIRVTGGERSNVVLFTSSMFGDDRLALAENFAAFAHEYQQRSVAVVGYVSGSKRGKTAASRPKAEKEEIPSPRRSFLGVDEFIRTDDVDIAAEKDFLNQLKERYDLVVVNYEPLQESPILIGLSDIPAWVVYRISAEKTNRFQASHALETLKVFGFNNIGVILSDRKFHIPDFLYRFL